MKRSVKHAALRSRWMTAAAIPVCATGLFVACSGQTGTNGLVVAPMTSVSVAAIAPPDAGPDGVALATRALPEEPHQPPNMSDCRREVSCVDPEPNPLTWPLPSPYERCKPVLDKGEKKFSAVETVKGREETTDACCYVSFEDCQRRYNNRYNSGAIPGRPLLDETGAMQIAKTEPREDWRLRTQAPREADAARALRWTEAARLEHASVASFAHFALSLMAVGAPPSLVAGAHQAAADEVTHAQLSFELASMYGGDGVGPGALFVARAPSSSLRELVRETLVSGCVNEAIAAALALEGGRTAEHDEERRALEVIARDEAEHAALAFRTVAWALSVDPELVRDEIRNVVSALDDVQGEGEDVVLDRATRAAVTRDVLTHAVRPCLLAMLRQSASAMAARW